MMNINKPLAIYLGIIILSLSIIGFTLYYFYNQMGGFKELTVVKLNPIERTMVGTSYMGKAQTPTYEKIVEKCVEQIQNNKLDGILTIVSYRQDTLESNEINLFIGVTLNSSMAEIPYDFEVRKFKSNMRYAVFLDMHPMVRPLTSTLEELLQKTANENGDELRNMFVELYYQDDSVTVEAWVK